MVAAALRRCRGCGCELALAPVPRYEVCRDCGWEPAPIEIAPGQWQRYGPQTQFLESSAREVLFGGAVGGGKSEVLLIDALRYIHLPTYRAALFRRTMPELRKSLIDRALRWYPKAAPGRFVGSPMPVWKFDSGAEIYFAHMQYEQDMYSFDGVELQYAGFDELSHFLEKMYVYITQSRMRSSHGIPIRVRAGTMPPDDLDGAWILKRFAPWLDRGPDYHGVQAESGQKLYVVNNEQKGELYVPRGTVDAMGNKARSRQFIQARVFDNPYLPPEYRSELLGLDPVSRARKLYGDWSALDKPGAVWQRALINAGRVAAAPALHRIGIGLDPSGSHRKGADEAGIIAAGMGPCFCSGLRNERGERVRENHAFVLEDLSGVLGATEQARRMIAAYHRLQADFAVAEINYGGEWIKATVEEIDPTVNVEVVHVFRGKALRAEPVAALYGKLEPDGKLVGCKVHHVGTLAGLENQQCTLDQREPPKVSPGRLDAAVILLTKLLLGAPDGVEGMHSEGERRWNPRRDRSGMMT